MHSEEERWLNITPLENIPLREGRKVNVGGRDIAIFNLGGDRIAAIEDRCPHSGGPLCDGIVTGNVVVCPLHAWRISLETGAVVKPESEQRVEVFSARVGQGIVQIEWSKQVMTQQEEIAA